MSQYYNIKEYQAGGEWKSSYGMFDSFFLTIEGHENDTVMVNKKQGNSPRLGQVYGELIFKKVGKKGQNVYQFKQLQAPDGMSPQASTGQSTSVAQVAPVERGQNTPEWFALYAVMIKHLYDASMGTNPGIAVVEKQEAQKLEEPFESPKADDTIPGTSLSKAELEDIFGGSMEPVEVE